MVWLFAWLLAKADSELLLTDQSPRLRQSSLWVHSFTEMNFLSEVYAEREGSWVETRQDGKGYAEEDGANWPQEHLWATWHGRASERWQVQLQSTIHGRQAEH